MSWQAMDAIDRIPYDACKPLEFRVLTKLANVAAQDGSRAYRTAFDMARELGVSHRSVQRALKALEETRILLRGDQRVLSHMRADKRPIVYDINMPKCLDWDLYHGHVTPTLDGTTSDTTQISTGGGELPHGTTSDTTTVVAYRELRELINSSSQGNHTGRVVPLGICGHELVDDRHCALGCPTAAEALTSTGATS